MNAVNTVLTTVVDWLMTLSAEWPPVVTLILISIASGILMAWIFGFTSPQRRLTRAVDLGRAQVLAIKLFKDELGTILSSLVHLFRYTGLRLWYSVPPMLVMVIPFVLLLAQLARWYEYRPLVRGETAVVELQTTAKDWPKLGGVVVEPPPQISVETKPLRDDKRQSIFWRIRASQPVNETLRWRWGSDTVEKQITVVDNGNLFRPVNVRRPGPGWWDRLLNPGEPAFGDDSTVQGITIRHPERSTPLLGLDVPWWATFFIVSILAAMLVRPLLNVQF